jgi:hypothetical protein
MDLILKALDNKNCTEYVKRQLERMSYFSDRISHDFNFDQGDFYIIIPEQVNPDYPDPAYYDFEIGGRIFPFKREEGESIQQHINYSDEIMMESIFEYIKTDTSNCVCVEDYDADPNFPYIKNAEREYYLINDKIFYLMDNKLCPKEIKYNFASAVGFGFICLVLQVPNGLSALELHARTEMNAAAKEEIFKNIDSFYMEVYDEESYLIWVKNPGKSLFFNILSKKVMQV